MNVAVLGTGLMGYPMAERLLRAGHRVIAFNRTVKKATPLKDLGAAVTKSPKEAIEHSQCIILMLANAEAIQTALFSSKIPLKNKTIIQMGTISPEESRKFHKKIIKQGGQYLECPVLGSRKEAREGTLILMVGSTLKQFKQWRGLLRCFGPAPKWVGTVGKAAALKLALNQMIASMISAFALSLGFVKRQGVKVDDFMGILRKSVLYAPTFDKKLPQMLKADYMNPNFSTRNMLKDVNLFLKEAKSKRLAIPALQGIRGILIKTIGKGFSDDDYCSIFETISPRK
ncbi:MAG: hydroxyacid dehydrogenase [Omnitrophica WOR_2 bacterium GWA2_47_8]|nr:MAG: hydroxyacid dehydrogenase [Omnitrophica WOR_2 bacterium GWA2_47_8]